MMPTPYGCDLFWEVDPMPMIPVAFQWACDGTIQCIRQACVISPLEHPDTGNVAYYGHPVGRAVWFTRYLVREARRLGLYPSTAQLEAETRQAA